VEILEFLWPPLADADGQRACVCYVLMLRTDGLLLCVPGSFFSPGELAPEGDDGAVRPGPSVELTAPAVALSEEGEWILAPSADPLAVTVVDFPASAASLLSPVELDSFLGTFFSEADLYPLAADVLRQARQWILAEGAGASTDYQTGASDPGQPQTEASLTEVVARLSDQLAKLQQAPLTVPAPRVDPKPQGACARETGAFNRGPADVDQDARLAAAITAGELPDVQVQPDQTSAMMAQSQALLTLVGHLAQGADPVLDSQGTATSSSRGSQTRQRLQAELASHSGAFAEKVKEKALLRMSPAGVGSTEPFSLCRYYERYGGFDKHKDLASWQVAIAFDLLVAGNSNGGCPGPPGGLSRPTGARPRGLYSGVAFAPGTGVQPFSPLADQKWVTSALGYLREMDLISRGRSHEEAAKGSPVGSKAGLGRHSSSEVDSEGLDACDLSFDGEFTFTSWAASLTRLVLKSGTCFAHFLSSSLHLLRSDVPSAPTALYPIPSPSALPVGRPVPLDVLRRSPNSLRISVYRRGTHLAARFGELTDFLLACGVGPDAYDGATQEVVSRGPLVPHAPGGPDCLRPYRLFEADGIVLHGEANWDISPYLPPGMLLAYRDPLVLETFPGTGGPAPSFQHEDPGEVLKLMNVWDSKGLLTLRPGGLPDIRCSRVFGSFKSPGKFRQIGDRRGPNSPEARLDGVSHMLPQGFLLTRLHVPRFTHQLLGSSTDRKDFYSQCKVPLERAFSNAVKPEFSLADFAGTRAHQDYVSWVLSEAGKEHCRRYLPPMDLFGTSLRRPALLSPTAPVHVLQLVVSGRRCGSGAGYCSSCRFSRGGPGAPLLRRRPTVGETPWSGVVIDDLFCVSCEPADLPDPRACDSARVVDLAKEAYAKAAIKGSDDKDVFGASVFCIAGPECDSSPAAVKEGLVTIGSPLPKRLALSLVSLLTATRRCVTEELASMITGGWTSALMFRRCAMAVAGSIFEQRVDRTTGDEGSPLVSLGPSSRQELVLLAVLAPLLASCVSVPYDRTLFASDASLRKGAYTYMRPETEVIKAIWLSSDARAFYTKLEGPFRATLAALGEEPVDCDAPAPPSCLAAASAKTLENSLVEKGFETKKGLLKAARPLGQRFDFLLVGPGPATLAPRLDCPDALEWAMHLLAQNRIGFACRCSLFCLVLVGVESSSTLPFGAPWDFPCRFFAPPRLPLQLVWWCYPSVPSGLPFTKLLLGVCAFGCHGPQNISICNSDISNRGPLEASGLSLACVLPPSEPRPPGHCPVFLAALVELYTAAAASAPEPVRAKVGFESLLVNDLLSSGTWQVGASWTWPPVLSSWGVDFTPPGSAHLAKDFDATLGYPAEGPAEPRGQRDLERQTRRSASALPSGRPVLPTTRSNRARLLGLFDAWLAERGSSLKALTSRSPLDPAAIGQALTNYGRDLYDAGRPYGDYSETVNAVGALCPSVRRQLQGSWDLAFSWMAAEPYTHHVPMPAALLLALLTCSLFWGWLREAAKLEQSDLVALVCLAFGDLPAGEALWPRTNQTLRARLDKLLARLGVYTARGQRSIDLGSFRPGGATHLLQVTEDSELVRRRGRWASPKVMEIYLQEVSAIQFLPRQPPAVRAAILDYAKAFPQVFAKAQQWTRQKVPPCTWYTLFSSGS
ncbi:unnamed protein product, partial [Symbiodinium necroappetens]